MNLHQFQQDWQALLDNCPINTRGWMINRPSILKEYIPQPEAYLIQSPVEDGTHLAGVPNRSQLSAATASELYRYAARRLSPISDDLQSNWNCEIYRVEDGTFIASFYNFLGGRLTVHGIQMTKNWCGVISDRGVIAQC